MALPKLFQRIFWHNNTTPAINEDNLNAMSKAIDDIDDRVINLASDVLEVIPEIQQDLADAEQLKDDCQGYAEDSEAWAKGTRDGVDVPSTDPAYHNNAKYYAQQQDIGLFVKNGILTCRYEAT